MSVNALFGQNLRRLILERSSIARVAEELGISRTQLQRYLKAESFPKPNLLKRICDLFQVDARIMTEPLTDALLQAMRAGPAPALAPGRQMQVFEAFRYAVQVPDVFLGPHTLENGLYVIWRKSFLYHDTAVRLIVQIGELNGVKTLRAFEARAVYSHPVEHKVREFRGFGQRVVAGYHFIVYQNQPLAVSSNIFLAPTSIPGARTAWIGFSTLAVVEQPRRTRMSRLLMERMGDDCRSVLHEARLPRFLSFDAVPSFVRDAITAPLD